MNTQNAKVTQAKTNAAIQMIGSWFGHKLDVFLGMAIASRAGKFRGATPPRRTKSADRKLDKTADKPAASETQRVKYIPFHLRPGYAGKKPLSRRDLHRALVAARSSL